MDLRSISSNMQRRREMFYYLDYQQPIIDANIGRVKKSIKNETSFFGKPQREVYSEWIEMNPKSPYELENVLLKNDWFIDRSDLELFEIPEMKLEIANSTMDRLTLFKERLLFYKYYEIIHFKLNNSGMEGMGRWELAQTITNDSTYFGSFADNSMMSNYQIVINDSVFELNSDNVYQIPQLDSIRIELQQF